MEPEVTVTSTELQWRFVTDYYDTPLSGFAYYQNKLHVAFLVQEWVLDGTWVFAYNARKLTFKERIYVTLKQFLFETFVGSHFSYYKNGKSKGYRKVKPKLAKFYFKHLKKFFTVKRPSNTFTMKPPCPSEEILT